MSTRRLFVAALIMSCAAWAHAKTNATDQVAADKPQKAVLDELNVARTKPQKYVEYLKQHRRSLDGKIFRGPGGMNLVTEEGVVAVDEAIEALSKQKPLTALKFSEGLSLAARDHVEDTGPKGVTGHDGTDGSNCSQRENRYGKWEKTAGENISYGFNDAKSIVLQLIIDDGVANRGHRINIYNKDYHVAGIACGPHKKYRIMCVIDFAGGYQDDKQAIRKRKAK